MGTLREEERGLGVLDSRGGDGRCQEKPVESVTWPPQDPIPPPPSPHATFPAIDWEKPVNPGIIAQTLPQDPP
jgi:hypothetical protein